MASGSERDVSGTALPGTGIHWRIEQTLGRDPVNACMALASRCKDWWTWRSPWLWIRQYMRILTHAPGPILGALLAVLSAFLELFLSNHSFRDLGLRIVAWVGPPLAIASAWWTRRSLSPDRYAQLLVAGWKSREVFHALCEHVFKASRAFTRRVQKAQELQDLLEDVGRIRSRECPKEWRNREPLFREVIESCAARPRWPGLRSKLETYIADVERLINGQHLQLERIGAMTLCASRELKIPNHRLCDHLLQYSRRMHENRVRKYVRNWQELLSICRGEISNAAKGRAIAVIEQNRRILRDARYRALQQDRMRRHMDLLPQLLELAATHSTSTSVQTFSGVLSKLAAQELARVGGTVTPDDQPGVASALLFLNRKCRAHPGFDLATLLANAPPVRAHPEARAVLVELANYEEPRERLGVLSLRESDRGPARARWRTVANAPNPEVAERIFRRWKERYDVGDRAIVEEQRVEVGKRSAGWIQIRVRLRDEVERRFRLGEAPSRIFRNTGDVKAALDDFVEMPALVREYIGSSQDAIVARFNDYCWYGVPAEASGDSARKDGGPTMIVVHGYSRTVREVVKRGLFYRLSEVARGHGGTTSYEQSFRDQMERVEDLDESRRRTLFKKAPYLWQLQSRTQERFDSRVMEYELKEEPALRGFRDIVTGSDRALLRMVGAGDRVVLLIGAECIDRSGRLVTPRGVGARLDKLANEIRAFSCTEVVVAEYMKILPDDMLEARLVEHLDRITVSRLQDRALVITEEGCMRFDGRGGKLSPC